MEKLAPIVIVSAAILTVIRVRRDLQKQAWFWAVIVLVLALHVPLLFIIRWPSDLWAHRMGMLPLAVADAFIVLGAVRFVENFIVKSPPPKEKQSES